MPVEFHIFPRRDLVYARFWGQVHPDESRTTFARYAQHPLCRPGQKQLVDFSGVTGLERDFVNLSAMQAEMVEVFVAPGRQTLMAFYAAQPLPLFLAALARRPWEGVPGVVARVFATESAALAFLGQPEASLPQLFAAAD